MSDLYRVRLTYDMVVEADGPCSAKREARSSVRLEEPIKEKAWSVEEPSDVPCEWHDAVPYGTGDGKSTVVEVMGGGDDAD